MKNNLGTKTQRKKYGSQVKGKVALAAIRGEQTANEIASLYGVHPLQVSKWKGQLLSAVPRVFDNGRGVKSEQELIDSLYRQIGKLQVENEWLKKKSGLL
jgi:transposase-like protein